MRILRKVLCAWILLALAACSGEGAVEVVQTEDTQESLEVIVDSEPTASDSSMDLDVEVYSGEFGTLVLDNIRSEGALFTYTNTTDNDYTICSEYLQVNGIEFVDGWFDSNDDGEDDGYYGGLWEDVTAGSTVTFTFLANIDSSDIVSVSGQFQVLNILTGEVLGLISFDYGDSAETLAGYNIEAYNGEYGTLTLTSITAEGFGFRYENNSGQTLALYSEHFSVDGTYYEDGWVDADGDGRDDYYLGGIDCDVADGMWVNCSLYVPDNNVNASKLAAQIQVCSYPDGTVLDSISLDIALK